MIAVLIATDGRVKEAGIDTSSGFPRLDEAALAAVRAWRFVPAKQGGVAVEMRYRVPVDFVLAREEL